jgi:hypothetical protein
MDSGVLCVRVLRVSGKIKAGALDDKALETLQYQGRLPEVLQLFDKPSTPSSKLACVRSFVANSTL